MSGLDALRGLTGRWTGLNRLWLPPAEAPYTSQTTASITPIVGGKFVQVAYTWAFDGVEQEGLLLIGQETMDQAVTAVWIDSWHMGDAFMICQGTLEANGTAAVRGSYAVEGGPDWGWRIVIEPGAHAFQMVMYNVAPDGNESLAVEATYTPST